MTVAEAKGDIVQQTTDLSGDRRLTVSVHQSGTHSITLDSYGGRYASFYVTVSRSDFKAIADLLTRAAAETESFAGECKHPEDTHRTVEYPGGVRIECGECGVTL